LPLVLEFSHAGFPVLGFDIDERKVQELKAGRSYIRHISPDAIRGAFLGGTADATTDFSRVAICDAVIICVPTPLTEHRDPDLSYIENTARQIGPHVKRGQLIVLESTTYPGTTEEDMVPILDELSGLRAGVDYFVAFSPEREDPNNKDFTTRTIPKVVGGLTPESLEVATALYGRVIDRTVPVSNCRTAEATKLMENIFRCINIALVNELKVVFQEMDIDIWEVIRAASTKPFGFMPFYPGPGLGGHCIPIDPFYLTWKAREFGVTTRFIELAGEINTGMPQYVVNRTLGALNERGKALKGSRVLLVGLAYKKNVDDDRESPTYVLWELFEKYGATVSYYDPFCPVVRPSREHSQFAGIQSVTWEQVLAGGFDVAVVSTAHDGVDHAALARAVPLVVDTRGACAPGANVVRA
jgi:UDP-N-acetyl-D-glucosamine dehydrogenase